VCLPERRHQPTRALTSAILQPLDQRSHELRARVRTAKSARRLERYLHALRLRPRYPPRAVCAHLRRPTDRDSVPPPTAGPVSVCLIAPTCGRFAPTAVCVAATAAIHLPAAAGVITGLLAAPNSAALRAAPLLCIFAGGYGVAGRGPAQCDARKVPKRDGARRGAPLPSRAPGKPRMLRHAGHQHDRRVRARPAAPRAHDGRAAHVGARGRLSVCSSAATTLSCRAGTRRRAAGQEARQEAVHEDRCM